jgi:DNA-binding MarR family transcriptional regulator
VRPLRSWPLRAAGGLATCRDRLVSSEAGAVWPAYQPMSRPLDFDPIIEASRQWSAHGWEEACDGMAAITSIVRAQQLFLGRIDAVLRPLELTFARYEVLMLLLFSRRGALPLNKIGARLQVHPTSVTNAVDRLEEQDLIKRVPHSSDRRTTLAEILPVGRELALQATRALNEEVFSQPGMSSDDLKELVEVLQRFRQGAGDFEEASGPAVRQYGGLQGDQGVGALRGVEGTGGG